MEDYEPRRAAFNMAIATLGRLDNILKRMEIVSEMMSGLSEQKLHLKLLRNFMVNASPLMVQVMKPEQLQSYQRKVFSLKIKSQMRKGKVYEMYSPKLSTEVMYIMMDIQNELREHFMPRGDDDDEL